VGFLLLPLYTRFLTPTDYGLLEIIEITAVILELLAGVGVTYAVFKFYHKCEDDTERATILSTAITTVMAINCVFAITGIFFSKYVAEIVLKDSSYFDLIVLVFFRLTIAGSIIIGLDYVRLIKKPFLYGMLSMTRLVSQIILNIYFLVFLKMSVKGILLSSIISAFLVGVPVIIYLYSRYGFHFSSKKMFGMLRFGIPLVGAFIGQLIINSADRYILQRVSGLSDVGIYSLGYKFGFLVNFLIVIAFQLMWEGKMFEIEKKENAKTIYSNILTYYVLTLLFTALIITVYIDNILVLMATAPFYPASIVVPYIAIAYVFNGLQEYFKLGMLLKNKTTVVGGVALTQCFISVGLYLLLGSNFGMIGIAVAVLISYFALLVANFIYSQRIYSVPIEKMRIFKIVGAFAFVILCNKLFVLDSIIVSMAVNTCSVILFPLLLFLIGFFNEKEIEKIKGFIKMPLKSF
jgi:O-antigen/teichoic acid export membrane protein